MSPGGQRWLQPFLSRVTASFSEKHARRQPAPLGLLRPSRLLPNPKATTSGVSSPFPLRGIDPQEPKQGPCSPWCDSQEPGRGSPRRVASRCGDEAGVVCPHQGTLSSLPRQDRPPCNHAGGPGSRSLREVSWPRADTYTRGPEVSGSKAEPGYRGSGSGKGAAADQAATPLQPCRMNTTQRSAGGMDRAPRTQLKGPTSQSHAHTIDEGGRVSRASPSSGRETQQGQ